MGSEGFLGEGVRKGGREEEPMIFLRAPTFSVKDLWPEKGTKNQDINKPGGGRKLAKQKTDLPGEQIYI